MEQLKTYQNHAEPSQAHCNCAIAGAPAALKALVRFSHWWSASLAIQARRIWGPVLAEPGRAMRALKGLDTSILGDDFNQHLGLRDHVFPIIYQRLIRLHTFAWSILVLWKSFEISFALIMRTKTRVLAFTFPQQPSRFTRASLC